MMKKRIAIDATPLLYTEHGIGRSTRMMIEALFTLACDYEFVLFGRRLQGRKLADIGFQLETHHLRLPRLFEKLIRKTGLIEKLCRADLYHATDFYMPLKCVENAVATVHDLIFLLQPEQMVDHVRLAQWTPEFIRRCRHIITVSEFSKKDIVNRLRVAPEKIQVIYHGIDRDVFYPAQDAEKAAARISLEFGLKRPYFLAVSCSTGRKNTPFLLEAYTRLLKNHPENDLVLVWNPPDDIRQEYGSTLNHNRIHFFGRQSDTDLADLYRGAAALVFPSLYEGFGLPLLEAMSCGTPVIASNVTSMPEIGGDAAFYIDPKDISSLIEAMESFENRQVNIDQLRRKCIERANQFSWEVCAQQTLSVYDRCLSDD